MQIKKYLLLFAFILMVAIPQILSDFWTVNIMARALALGVIALSLTFLSSYCGMVSLCQMTIAGVAGYGIAFLSPNASGVGYSMYLPYATIISLILALLFSAFIGWISQRSYEVYLLMFTLAVGVSVFYFVQQNTVYFNGSDGIAGVSVPNFLKKGFHYDAVPFLNYANTTYWFMLICAFLLFALTIHLNTTPLGLVFKSIRDNPRRLNALGYSVSQYRVLAFVISGFIAGIGGIMLTWYNAQISPGTIDVGGNVAILIIAVLGGQKNLLGAFIGAFVYVLLELFASELIGPERFNLVIGATFLLVLYFSPNGIIGLLPMIAKTFRRFKCRI